jgi:hypothetical protein
MVPGMKSRVHFEDTGTVYDAPLEALWDFILHDEVFHPEAHKDTLRNFKWKDVSEITGVASCEVQVSGHWIKKKSRITTIPPIARIQEELTGRYAGSKIVYLYTPRGKKTGVDVYAELASDTSSPEELENEWRKTLSGAYNEDVPWLRKFIRKRSRKEP